MSRLCQKLALVASALSLSRYDGDAAQKTSLSALLAISMTALLRFSFRMIQNNQLKHLIPVRMTFARHVLAERRRQVMWEDKHISM